jgi:predicted AAA+ superfamily ATPase
LRRFQQLLTLLAGRVGQLLNYASLGNDIGVSAVTIKDWISVLTASFVVFELPPYYQNISKRVIKTPKLYFTDTGLAAHLAGIRTSEQAQRDPLRGGLYENLMIVEVLKRRLNRGLRPDLFFYRDARGVEVDLLVQTGRTLVPIEIKSAATFHPDFHRSLERFRAATAARTTAGAVFYSGKTASIFHDARVLNPLLHVAWDSLLIGEG